MSTTHYIRVPIDYALNKALEAIGSDLRIGGEEAKKATYTKKKSEKLIKTI